LQDGFWETFVHRVLRAGGHQLFLDPDVVVSFQGGFGWAEFATRRFAHARFFAARNAETMSTGERLFRGVASPLVPFLLLARIIRRGWVQVGYRVRLLMSLPVLFSFLVAWGCGEGVGYLLGAAERRAAAESNARVGSSGR
jgi:hypothetical protein